MNHTLLGFVILYLVASIGIGMYAATKVKNTEDYVAAGRSLPMIMVIAMVFATWFGAETVLGIPATFLDKNLGGTISDPFGASLALILFGLFFAKKLYRMNLLTLGDFSASATTARSRWPFPSPLRCPIWAGCRPRSPHSAWCSTCCPTTPSARPRAS